MHVDICMYESVCVCMSIDLCIIYIPVPLYKGVSNTQCHPVSLTSNPSDMSTDSRITKNTPVHYYTLST